MALLAEEAGGWWTWPTDSPDPRFVPMARWLEMVDTLSRGKKPATVAPPAALTP